MKGEGGKEEEAREPVTMMQVRPGKEERKEAWMGSLRGSQAKPGQARPQARAVIKEPHVAHNCRDPTS
jgi:hypothetical protein